MYKGEVLRKGGGGCRRRPLFLEMSLKSYRFLIEDAMRRAHRRPRDPGSAIPPGTWWSLCGVSVRTVCELSGS